MKILENIVWRDVDNEVVILDIESGNYFTLDGVGRMIWKHLADGNSIADTTEAVINEYDVSEENAKSDIEGLIEQLKEEKIIEE